MKFHFNTSVKEFKGSNGKVSVLFKTQNCYNEIYVLEMWELGDFLDDD